MLCPSCQQPNPEENRFCGHCGCDFSKHRTIYPREGYDEKDLPPVSDVETDVPRFRRNGPPLAASEYGPPPEAPIRTPVVTHDVEVRDVPVQTVEKHAVPEPPRETIRNYGSPTSILFNLDPSETTPPRETPKETPRAVENVVAEPPKDAPAPPHRSEGIHGPSFLGLGDSGEPDFLDDLDEPSSHTRRNWLLIALAVLIVLGALQWRNIRDTGMNFAGSMKLNLPGKKDNPSKPTAENAATDNHSENGAANDGKPEMVVNPQNTGTADKSAQSPNAQSVSKGTESANAARQDGGASQSTAEPKSSEQQGSATAKKDDGTPAKSETGKQPTQEAKNNANDTSDDESADSSDAGSSADTEKPAKAASKTSATHAAAKPAAASAGAEELARANQASSPETAAKWLWASTSKGNLDAPVRLADMYANGRGVSKDCEQATVLLRSSARRGNPRASARLGMYYATGQCVQQDRTQAWHWLSLAHHGDPNSDWIRQYRERLWSEMSPDERARAGNGPMSNASE